MFANDMESVCKDIKVYTRKSEKWGFTLNKALKSNIDLMVKHVKKDWDFVFIISGHGQVRVGKSVLGQQVGAYISEMMGTPWGADNIVFDSTKLQETSFNLPAHSVIVYDEARDGLNSKKAMSGIQQDLIDYFTQCGQLNQFFILILPDFFDLEKGIAVTRSICLIDVYWAGEFQRGRFNFYNSTQKRSLYFNGKRYQNYSAARPSFPGYFYDGYTVPREEYKKKKMQMLINLRKKEISVMGKKEAQHSYWMKKVLVDTYNREEPQSLRLWVNYLKNKYGIPIAERTWQRWKLDVEDHEKEMLQLENNTMTNDDDIS